MAAASGSLDDDDRPRPGLQRRNSLCLPPDLSELRVVLLGNSWFERSSVGNFILGAPVFDTQKESDGSEKVSGKIDETRICVINTPDLLHRKIPERKLKKQVGLCMRLAAPGPHVFLLVLQAEDFTEEQNVGLCRVLRLFSDRAFDHSLVLISSREQGSGSLPPSLNNFNRTCKYNYRKLHQLSHPELLAQMAQITFRTHGAHVGCEEDSAAPHVQTPAQREAAASELKIVLLGDSDYEKTKLGNFIIRDQAFSQAHSRCVSACGEWGGRRFSVVKAPDTKALSKEPVRAEVRTLCSAPAVLLLVVRAGFTEGDRKALMSILPLFGEDPVKYSLVVLSHDCTTMTDPLATLLNACGKRHYFVDEDNRRVLMKKVEDIVLKNKEPLNMVLCGSGEAPEAFLGLLKGDVWGRQMSLVQLPALYRKRHEAKLNESLRCVSHCDPEGVHAFLLFLPLGRLRDEDKKELQSIQSVFGSGVNDFTLIVFVDSDAADPAVVDFQQSEDFQELCQRCGGRYVVVNTQDQQQVISVLDAVEKMKDTKDKDCSYTTKTFTKAQIKTIVHLQEVKDRRQNMCDEDAERPECLRIVLIGKTGSGKSASANTILGRQEFRSELNQRSVTKNCQKAKNEVNGRPLVVVDTPGLFDTDLTHEDVYEELVKCVTLLAPGPHVFLLVIKIDKFTEEDRKTLKLIKKGFGQRSQRFTIVLLTGGDKLKKENISIEEFIENRSDVFFKRLISDCGGRVHVLNNLDRENLTQVPELMDKICSMVKDNGGSCFTNEMLQQSEAALHRDVQRIMKENEQMRRQREELKRKHEEELRAMKNKMEKQREESELEKKIRERELREKKADIQKLEDRIKELGSMREKEKRERTEQEERQRQEWEERLEAMEQEMKSKEKETVNIELVQRKEELRREQERERKDWCEKKLLENLRMARIQLQKLKEELEQEKEKLEEKEKKDLLRKEQEESERRKVEEKYNERMEELKEKQEEEARRKAEKLNKFKHKYEEDLEALLLQHEKELEQTEEKHREEKEMEKKQKDIEDLRREQNEEIKNLKKKHRKNCKIA